VLAGAWNIANEKTLSGWLSRATASPGGARPDWGVTLATLPVPEKDGWALSVGQ